MTGLAQYSIPTTKLYRNDSGNLVDTGLNLGNLAYSSAAWSDFDNDGKLDLMLMGATNNDPNHPTAVIRLFKNTSLTPNSFPTAPGNLQVTYQQDKPVLSWVTGSDTETPASGLSYNMRMGTTSGGIDVISGMSDATGLRKVPAMGPIKGNSWSFDGVTLGTTYYWSVQSIDSAFAGSQWSAENKICLLKVSGYVKEANGQPISGVTITANNGGGVTTTDSNGYYEILLNQGWSGRIVPSKPLYLFDPARLNYTNLQDHLSNQNFTGTPPAWEGIDVGSAGFGYSDVSVGDFNCDGRLDIAAIGSYAETGQLSRTMMVFRNDGDNRFTEKTINTNYYGSLDWGDYDNNGYLDLVYSGAYTLTTTGIYQNNGDENFSLKANPANIWGDVSWADFNNDGRLDLAVTGREGVWPYHYYLKILRNNADSTWTTMNTGYYGYEGALAWADFDNDGDLDLMVSGSSEYNGLGSYSRRTRLYRNDG
ncbi:MAG TPA: FG-GAP-like repeat-containing protein, partial [Armatimonadota bacterium]|nr:FG-GAP-like repeat-containing protein [Armatimonadota bacterium]